MDICGYDFEFKILDGLDEDVDTTEDYIAYTMVYGELYDDEEDGENNDGKETLLIESKIVQFINRSQTMTRIIKMKNGIMCVDHYEFSENYLTIQECSLKHVELYTNIVEKLEESV